ncbi:PorT family protein [Psychroflexus sp. CAK1W]|uniref:porin family protein n=1 Tax=Psychroflexus curvus TaxID=2873595 RepID=UPI001CCB7BF7|nr:porin family protein [Psychroflexus curvus]MBZ9628977.1 PorT family protein [Psychroflexus curvus]
MKLSIISLFALFICSISSLSAQQEYVEYGFKGGINLANVSGDVPPGYDSRTSMKIGAYGLYKILPKFGLQAELLYSEQGFSNEYNQGINEAEKVEEILKMQYVNLPVLASYNVIENLWLEGGVQFGYLVRAEMEQETVTLDPIGEVNSKTETIDQNDRYESLDIALAGGLRYKLSRNFMVQARFHQSLNDVDKNLEGDQYHSVYSFSVGYVF